ncbi:DUF1080 domain-containing protein [Rhodocytophaga rosea]|uniref:DUF1080 domain-containing protein n=1 Tax=Rhodocytophaga rosea TaxID=2704465 RepID=A0A6C0GLH7_9BACT|nr:family 16 glycoside hydrolase [Rhodocytophaga rosea]QHT68503.1 DUF1080 domain-containing protein [Rhodocytophaga rosea]
MTLSRFSWKIIPLLIFCCFTHFFALAQKSLLFTPVSLDDLSAFKPVAGNWKISGDVTADRSKDQTLQVSSGKGVLVNLPDSKNKDNIFAGFEHGNIELELDFMMAKGSNSGIYLQGRYEVQLFDSWGVTNSRSSDCAAIYGRWDEKRPDGQKSYEGHPPRVNVSRAPGLWQTMKIVFQAPVFNAQGKKTKNARFIKVIHNGVVVHENVELTGPTQSAAFQVEKPFGPLMLQGDHGPVAFRNIRYKRYDQPAVQLNNLAYKYYEGKFNNQADFIQLTAKKSGKVEEKAQLVESPNNFALQLNGTFQAPSSGEYLFEIKCMGGATLSIDGKPVISYDGFHYPEEWASGQTNLQAGSHEMTINYFRSQYPWLRSMLSMYVEGPGVVRQPVALPTSLPDPEYIEPILVNTPETRMVRSFIWDNNHKRTNCISVGEPGGIHYTVDLNQGSLFQVWKGGFLDATDMWHDRGEPQIVKPVGSTLIMSGEPALAMLASNNAVWPDSVKETDNFQFKGYSVDARNRPTFRYTMNGLNIQDQTLPDDNNRMLNRQIQVKSNGQDTKNLWCLVASGSKISQLPDGAYSINDKMYYLEVETGGEKPVIRKSKNREELLIPVRLKDNQASVKYRIIW